MSPLLASRFEPKRCADAGNVEREARYALHVTRHTLHVTRHTSHIKLQMLNDAIASAHNVIARYVRACLHQWLQVCVHACVRVFLLLLIPQTLSLDVTRSMTSKVNPKP